MPKLPNDTCVALKGGGFMDLKDPSSDDVSIFDVADGLGACARWSGQSNHFYSVAQHSVFVESLVEDEHKLAALLHDAEEYLWGDLATPAKRLCPDFKFHALKLRHAVGAKYGLTPEDFAHSAIKRADMIAAVTERRDITNFDPSIVWTGFEGIEPAKQRITACFDPVASRNYFIERFRQVLKIHEDMKSRSSSF